jgi:hypothetical protein
MWETALHNLTLTEIKQLSSDEYYSLVAMNQILVEEQKERNKKSEGK